RAFLGRALLRAPSQPRRSLLPPGVRLQSGPEATFPERFPRANTPGAPPFRLPLPRPRGQRGGRQRCGRSPPAATCNHPPDDLRGRLHTGQTLLLDVAQPALADAGDPEEIVKACE